MNGDKIILHLCAKEGSDSIPYREAGYDVQIIGEEIGVENYNPPPNVYGIIANPPCTMFSQARTRLVKECLRIIWECQYRTDWNGDWSMPLKFWMIENPATGFLKWFLGNPTFQYAQHEYGGIQTKRTALWGAFNLPKRPLMFNQLPPGSHVGGKNEIGRDMQVRSRCPIDFAKAFYEANP